MARTWGRVIVCALVMLAVAGCGGASPRAGLPTVATGMALPSATAVPTAVADTPTAAASPTAALATEETPPGPPAATGSTGRHFGVNYVYHGLKQAVRQAGVSPEDYIRAQNEKLAALGVGWVRSAGPGDPTSLHWPIVEPRPGEFDWTLHDLRVRLAAEYDLQMLGSVDFSVVPGYAQSAGTYFDDARYLEYLSAIVERYDGDGRDDMPGLAKPIMYWEIGNEVVIARNFRGTPQDYAHVLDISSREIRASCADCRVLIGGWIIGKRDDDRWQRSLDYLEQVLAAGGGRAIDLMNYHEYTPGGDFLTDYHVGAFRDLLAAHGLSKPIWITEGNTPLTPKGEAAATLAQQAQDVVKRIVIALGAGVDVYFWHGLDDVEGGPGSGLYNADGTLKPNGYNLRQLSTMLDGFEHVERVDLDSGDLYLYRFDRPDRQSFALWTEGAEAIVDLSGKLGAGEVQLVRAIVDAGVSEFPTTSVPSAQVPFSQTPAFIVVKR